MSASGVQVKEIELLTVALSLLEFPIILGTNSDQTRIHSFDDEELED